MKRIDITAGESVKVAHVDGDVIGFLPLNSAVYGLAGMEGTGLLYAHNKDADTWHMITPKTITDYPAAERHVARTVGGKPYVIMG